MSRVLIGTALAVFITGSASAQESSSQGSATDSRWQPWVGCWQLIDESVGGRQDVSAEDVAQGGGPTRSRRNTTGTRVCVTPAGGGVTLATVIGEQQAFEETIVADGASHPTSDAECRGSKRSEWSKSAPRLYSAADITCQGERPRKISSLSMMTPGPTWLDIQVIEIEGRKSIRIRRLRRAAESAVNRRVGAPVATESSWTVEDVKEASAKLAPEAVQAALVELRATFDLKGKQLLDLKNARVSEPIIDLMVALSYPDRFVVERPVSVAPSFSSYGSGGFGMFDDAMWPFYMDSMFWPSYYSPFAYRYWGFYDPYYYPGAGYIVLPPGGSVDPGPVPSGVGRVVDGRGYTRVTTRTPEPVRTGNRSGAGNGTSSGGSSTNSGSSSGSSSGVSTGGYSSGGGSTGRTAMPRPPGR